MADSAEPTEVDRGTTGKGGKGKAPKKKRRSRFLRFIVWFLMIVIVAGVAVRLALPSALRWYVNRIIDQNSLYDGSIGDIDVSLWRGAYTIKDIRLVKTDGNVPVPLLAASQMDLAVEWKALMAGKVVGRIEIDNPELNFVDGESPSEDQTGAGGPWLKILNDLFPFKINSLVVHNGSIHFRAFASKPPIDLPLTQLEASIENLSNIHDDITPLVATVKATGLALDHAKVQYEMKLNPSSYRPTFQLAVRLLGLDVTKTNDLTRAYGGFDFEDGWFDLVVEVDSREGRMEGYVKPLFRNLKVLSLSKDIVEDNPIEFFWEALVAGAAEILKNHPRDQVATFIPLSGNVDKPQTDILATIGNVLRNAFIRAYLPRLQGLASDVDGIQFGAGSITEPPAVGAAP